MKDDTPYRADPQLKPVVPPKEIVNMNCRSAGGGCGGQQAYVSLKITLPWTAGGGTVYHYRCCKCGKKFVITR